MELDPSTKEAFRLYIGQDTKRHNRYFRLIQAACFEARRLKHDYTINMSLESIGTAVKNTFFIVILGVYNSLDPSYTSRLSIEIPSEPLNLGCTWRSISFRRHLSLNNSVPDWSSSDLDATILPTTSHIKRSFSSKDLFAIDQAIEMDVLDPDPEYAIDVPDEDLMNDSDPEYAIQEMQRALREADGPHTKQSIQVEFLQLQSQIKRHLSNGNLQLDNYLTVNQEEKDNSHMLPEPSKIVWTSFHSPRRLHIIDD